VSRGWVGNPPRYNFYVIDCYDDTGLAEDEYCDKSGSWDTWTVKKDLYTDLPSSKTQCDGFDLYQYDRVRGTDTYQRGQLIEANAVMCGCVQPRVNVTTTCVGFDLYTEKQKTACVDEYVPDELIDEKSSECGYVCDWGEKKLFTCPDGSLVLDSICGNNTWKIANEHPERFCPVNIDNINLIARSYIEALIEKIRGWL
jgi:hypothetical protein